MRRALLPLLALAVNPLPAAEAPPAASGKAGPFAVAVRDVERRRSR